MLQHFLRACPANLRRPGSDLLGTLVLLGVLGAASPGPCAAQEPRVVWSRDSLVYVELSDSAKVAQGDALDLFQDRRRVARGTVVRRDDQGLALVQLFIGSVRDSAPSIDRGIDGLPLPLDNPARMQVVGVPAPTRSNPLFPCGSGSQHAAVWPLHFHLVSSGPKRIELVRDSLSGRPDTLIVRWFDSVADQEIAVERGDIDVAVFWPGELSSHMREQSRWQGFRRGMRTRESLLACAVTGTAPRFDAPRDPTWSDSALVAKLGRGRFRDDLIRILDAHDSITTLDPKNPRASRMMGWFPDGSCAAELPFWVSSRPMGTRRLEGPGVLLVVPDDANLEFRKTARVVASYRLNCPILIHSNVSPTLLDSMDLADLMGVLQPATKP